MTNDEINKSQIAAFYCPQMKKTTNINLLPSIAGKILLMFFFMAIIVGAGCLPLKTTTSQYTVYADGHSVSMLLLSKGGKRLYLLSPEGSFPEWGNYLELVLLHPSGPIAANSTKFEAPTTLKGIQKEVRGGTLVLDRAKQLAHVKITSGEKSFNGTRAIDEIVPLIDIEELAPYEEIRNLSTHAVFNRAMSSSGDIQGIPKQDIWLSYLCSRSGDEGFKPGTAPQLYTLDNRIGFLYNGKYAIDCAPTNIGKFDKAKIEKLKSALTIDETPKKKTLEELYAEVQREVERSKQSKKKNP